MSFTGNLPGQNKTLSKEKSPRLTYPKIPPYKAVLDYRISQNFAKLDKLYPEFDVVRQNDPKSNLSVLQIRLHKTEKLLRQKRRDLVTQRQELDKQWQDLREKEMALRENFEHFDTFVRENMEKRDRALKKIKEDTVLKNQRQKEIDELAQKLASITEAKSEMDGKITEYHLYEEFLNQVVESSAEFKSIPDMINRYLALLNAKTYLAKLQEENLKALENARSDMMKLMEEKNFMIMGLNNQIANLQARFENANIKSLECEQMVIQIKNNAVKQMNEIDEVKSSVWNVCNHIALSKKHTLKVKKDQIEDQMMFIKRTLTELSRVNHMLRKKSKVVVKKSK